LYNQAGKLLDLDFPAIALDLDPSVPNQFLETFPDKTPGPADAYRNPHPHEHDPARETYRESLHNGFPFCRRPSRARVSAFRGRSGCVPFTGSA